MNQYCKKQELSPTHMLCLEDSGHSFYVQMNSSLGVIEDEMIIVRGSLDLWGGEPKGFEPQVTHGWQRAIDHVTNDCCEYQMSCEHQRAANTNELRTPTNELCNNHCAFTLLL